VHLLEHRLMFLDRQPIEVIEPVQRLVDPHVASHRLLPRGTLRGSMLQRSDAAAVGLRHTRTPLVCPHPLPFAVSSRNATARSRHDGSAGAPAACPDPLLKGLELHNGHCLGSWVNMATAEECRKALESLTGRLSEMNPEDRAAHLVDRVLSCRVVDLGITFLTQLGSQGAGPVTEATDGQPTAQVKFTTKSDDLIVLAEDPGSIGRAWLTGRLKVEASIFDLLRLRKLL
jgi:hypothetical protein